MNPSEMTARASALLPEALEWLKQMVGINSFTTNAKGVDLLGRLTADCFEALGFEASLAKSTHPHYGHHLFLERKPTLNPEKAIKPVVLVTHLDTVFPAEEEARNHFHWQLIAEEGRIYGPGTVDNKGGTIMIWLLLRVIQEMLPELYESTHWLVAANAAEEVIGSDFAERTAEMATGGAQAVLVFEGGPREGENYHLVTARKGRAEYRISCVGRAAHAGSTHADGVNAVVELARILPAVAELTDYKSEVTVNIASFQGGTVLNRVPHEAVVDLEIRAFDPAVMSEVESRLMGFHGVTDGGAAISVQCLGRTPGWPGGSGTEALVQHWEKAAEEMGLKVVPVSRGGLSDANYLCGLGPTLDALGPFGANAHCSEWGADVTKRPEFVAFDSFVPKAVMNVLALVRLLK